MFVVDIGTLTREVVNKMDYKCDDGYGDGCRYMIYLKKETIEEIVRDALEIGQEIYIEKISGRLTGIVQETSVSKKGPGLFTIPSME